MPKKLVGVLLAVRTSFYPRDPWRAGMQRGHVFDVTKPCWQRSECGRPNVTDAAPDSQDTI